MKLELEVFRTPPVDDDAAARGAAPAQDDAALLDDPNAERPPAEVAPPKPPPEAESVGSIELQAGDDIVLHVDHRLHAETFSSLVTQLASFLGGTGTVSVDLPPDDTGTDATGKRGGGPEATQPIYTPSLPGEAPPALPGEAPVDSGQTPPDGADGGLSTPDGGDGSGAIDGGSDVGAGVGSGPPSGGTGGDLPGTPSPMKATPQSLSHTTRRPSHGR